MRPRATAKRSFGRTASRRPDRDAAHGATFEHTVTSTVYTGQMSTDRS
jgi:hypothetical protein